jgi:abelson tyrosine-protein kinase 1
MITTCHVSCDVSLSHRLKLINDPVILPLWTPSPISLGAVGYLEKPSGSFITLFNSFNPAESSKGTIADLPSLDAYGRIGRGEQRQDKRSAARRGIDALAGFLTFKTHSYVSKYPHKHALI